MNNELIIQAYFDFGKSKAVKKKLKNMVFLLSLGKKEKGQALKAMK